MKNTLLISGLILILVQCQSQNNSTEIQVGGRCEGCEGIFEYGDKNLGPTDTIPGFEHNEPQLLVTGKVFLSDGQSPASNVIVYIYHTDRGGIYPSNGETLPWGKRHGKHRGWIKTNAYGEYSFYTFRPGSYPSRTEPEHIHFIVKEPGKSAYWIDDIWFEDDPLLTETMKANNRKRGGNGILQLETDVKYLVVRRDIILGMNVANYE